MEISKSRRWTVLASGFLCLLLALVVLFTSPRAFHSPIAVLVVASIGFAALLLQLRFASPENSHAPQPHAWLNSVGTILAVGAVILDFLRVNNQWVQALALAAIVVFGLSGVFILHTLRRQRLRVKTQETDSA
jgi:membrane protein YdbS with pleckstrin-like domain